MKTRNAILTITAIALIAGAGVVFAQQGPGDCDGSGPRGPHGAMGGGPDGGPGGPGLFRMLNRFADTLELTEAQQTQIQAIAEAGRTEIEPLREQAQTEREAFRDSREMGQFDEAAFRAHFEAQSQLHVEMQLIGAERSAQAFNVLTLEQQEELQEILELFGDGRGKRGTKRGGGAGRRGFN